MKKKSNSKSQSQKEVDALLDVYNKQKGLVHDLKKSRKDIKKSQKESAIPQIYDASLKSLDFIEETSKSVLKILKKVIDKEAKNL